MDNYFAGVPPPPKGENPINREDRIRMTEPRKSRTTEAKPSFANAQQSQQDAEFAAKREQFIAQSYLQELQASNQLTQEQFQASTQKFQVAINEMNLEGDIAAKLTAGATTALGNVATAQAELDAKNAAGVGSFVGTLASAGIGAAGNIFRGAGAAGGAGGAGSAGGATMAAAGGDAFLSDAEMAAILAA
jgi:hypothetical protein